MNVLPSQQPGRDTPDQLIGRGQSRLADLITVGPVNRCTLNPVGDRVRRDRGGRQQDREPERHDGAVACGLPVQSFTTTMLN